MKDDPDLPRERERLAAQQTIDNARAQLDGTPNRDTGELEGGLYRRLDKLDAERATVVAEIDERLAVIDASEACVAEIEAEYGPRLPLDGVEIEVVAGADVGDAAWLAEGSN